MHCSMRAHATKACKIKVLVVFNKIARHKRAHTRVFSTRVCKVDIELYCINKNMSTYFLNNIALLIRTYKESDKLQNKCTSLPIATVTVPVHMCSVVNQV